MPRLTCLFSAFYMAVTGRSYAPNTARYMLCIWFTRRGKLDARVSRNQAFGVTLLLRRPPTCEEQNLSHASPVPDRIPTRVSRTMATSIGIRADARLPEDFAGRMRKSRPRRRNVRASTERLELRLATGFCFWGRNSAEWVAAFFGCILRGAVAVPDGSRSHGRFRALRGSGGGRQAAARLTGRIRSEWRTTPRDPARFAARGGRRNIPAKRTLLLRSTEARSLRSFLPPGPRADPKGVVISHGNILANLEPLETEHAAVSKVGTLRASACDFWTWCPLSHVFGQFMGVWIPPLLGGSVYFQDSLNPSEIISTIRT